MTRPTKAAALRLAVAELSAHVERRRAARRPTGLQFVIADRIGLVDSRSWDTVARGASCYLQRDYLAMLEAHGPANLSPRYAIAAADGVPVVAMAMQIVDIEGERLVKAEEAVLPTRKRDKLKRLITPQPVSLMRNVQLRVLVCGNLLTYGQHGVAIAAGTDPELAWTAVGEVLYRVRRAEKRIGAMDFVLLKDFTKADATGSDTLHALSFRSVETDPNMVLATPPAWHSYDDYVASLASKYKSSLKSQILKPIDDAGLVLARIVPGPAEAERLHELYRAVQANASVRPVTLPISYFPALAATLGERCRCAVLKRDDTILGFVITLLDGETAVAYHIGFDRSASATLPLYLRLLHASVEDSILLGAKRISLGRTALEPKARLGARPDPMHVWVRHRQPVLNRMLRGLLGMVPHDDAPERNPFRKDAAARSDQ